MRSILKMMEKSIASIRNALSYVRSSSIKLDTFKSYVEKERLESIRVKGCFRGPDKVELKKKNLS